VTLPLSVPARLSEAVTTPVHALHGAEGCTMVIFGAGGDLTRRKLIPSLFHLMIDGLLPSNFSILGVDHHAIGEDEFRQRMRMNLQEFGFDGGKPVAPEDWERFAQRLGYLTGELGDRETYVRLRRHLTTIDERDPSTCGRLFYLAIPPSLYPTVITQLSQSGAAPRVHEAQERPWTRIVIEKPFGRDLDSARELNALVRRSFAEHQIYRIDHYLGKETVQNLLVFRFANSIFEPVWNRLHVHHVQITAAEQVGVEHRGRYYEEAGVVRDMFQNHLLQLVALTAMEPPITFSADAVRDEKLKVLKAIRPITPEEMHDYSVRGQYGPGVVNGTAVPGYRDEPNVARDSGVPTYAAVRFMIDNWRWHDVPFYLRSGKRLPHRATEIAIQFRKPPHLMFPLREGEALEPNVLAIRIQPNEGISLRFEVKIPGVDVHMVPVEMNFDYNEVFGGANHEAYETLLLDCMQGEATLFTRSDEVEAAWAIVDPMMHFWEGKRPEHFPNYAAGTWGPTVADEFIERMGARWRKP